MVGSKSIRSLSIAQGFDVAGIYFLLPLANRDIDARIVLWNVQRRSNVRTINAL